MHLHEEDAGFLADGAVVFGVEDQENIRTPDQLVPAIPMAPDNEGATCPATLSSVGSRHVEDIDVTEMSQLLMEQTGSVLDMVVVDCRPYLAYSASHIAGAHNVCYPSLLERRRLRRQAAPGNRLPTIPLENVIRCDKVRRMVREGLCHRIIVYDENTNCIQWPPSSCLLDGHGCRLSNASQLMSVLCSLAIHTNCELHFLRGGFESFSALSSHLVRSDHWQYSEAIDARLGDNLSRRILHRSDTFRCHPATDQGDPVEVLPWLFIGNAFHAANVERLSACGISALLNMADSTHDDLTTMTTTSSCEARSLCHVNIAVADNCYSDISSCFPKAIDFIESIRESGGKVLIHCRAGISRSATVCIAYLMYAGRLTLDDAHDYLKHCRPLISPNLNFMRQLAEFESSLTAGRERSSPAATLCRPSSDLTSSVQTHCSERLGFPAESNPAAMPKSRTESETCGGGKKRKMLSELLLPCGPAAAKVSRPGLAASAGLQPPPTPCTKQAFAFDLASVAVLMSAHASAGSPTVSHSPLVSPS